MRVAVLSDTHLKAGKSLPAFVWDNLTDIDLILHAGDIVNMNLLSDLACIATVRAVSGNCDGWGVSLPKRDIVECEDCRIGLVHGNAGWIRNAPETAYNVFKDAGVQAIVFGHSHAPHLEWRNGILLFNPGSPTNKRRAPYYSFGLMEINGSRIEARHLFFE